MNVEVTTGAILSIIAISVGIISSNFFERYEKKSVKIKTAILGLLENAKDNLVKQEFKKSGQSQLIRKDQGKKHVMKEQERNYEDLITFMRKSNFLKYANEYEELLNFEGCGQNKLYKLGFTVGGFIIPIILLQQEGGLFSIGLLWVSVNFSFLVIFIFDLNNMIKRIDGLYKEYISGKESFGGYDL